MRTIIAAIAVLAILGVAGCSTSTAGGGHGSGSASGAASFPASSSSAPSSSAPSSESPVPSSGSSSGSSSTGGLSKDKARAALLVTSDVGADFSGATGTDNNNPLACTPNDPPLNAQVSSQRVQAAFQQSSGQASLSEQIAVYADDAAAEKALAVSERGLACSSATVDAGGTKTPVTISGPTPLTSELSVTVDKCEGWTLQTKAADVGLVTARIGQQLVTLAFSSLTGADQKSLPDSQAITDKALTKVKDAL